MREGKIAIISKNKSLSRFFELEAKSCGLEATVFDKNIFELKGYSLIIIDIDTIKHTVSAELDKLLVVSEGAEPLPVYKGAEYISWPVSIERLRDIYERVKLGRLIKTDSNTENIPLFNNGVIYFFRDAKNTVEYNNRSIVLSDYEFKLIELLCMRAPDAVSREELNSLFGAPKGNIADVYICKLRKKLEEHGERLIFTVRFRGYKIKAHMEWR